MNRYATYFAGGALLATTALASGTLSAATLRTGGAATNLTAGSTPPAAFTNVKVGSTLFGSSAVNISKTGFSVLAGTTYGPSTQATIVTISGAEFDTTATGPTITYAQIVAGSVTNETTAGASVTVFTDKLLITGFTVSYSTVNIASAVVKNAQSLATAGNSVTLAGAINNAALTFNFESIAPVAVYTSVLPGSFAFNSTSTTASTNAIPVFSNFGSSAAISALIATVNITNLSGVSTDLATVLSPTAFISTAELRITHGSLNDPAFNLLNIETGASIVGSKSASQAASGVATFTLAGVGAQLEGGGGYTVNLSFLGTTSITAATGNTATVTATPGTSANAVALAAQTGSIGSVNRGGFTSAANLFQNSFNTIPSLLRITNSGLNPGTYTITVRNSATGTTLGTYTGAAISPNTTVQLTAANIEAGAGVAAPTSFGQYQLAVSAAFNGYIQDLTFSSSTGVVSNLSPFRIGTGGSAP